jgi:hypothetical protein
MPIRLLMIYRHIIALVLFAGCVTPKGAAPVELSAKASSPVEFRDWITYFYVRPNVNQLPGMLRFMSDGGVFVRQPEMLMVFLSKVFEQHQDKLKIWSPHWQTLDEAGRNVVWGALLMSGTQNGEQLLKADLLRSSADHQKQFVRFMDSLPVFRKAAPRSFRPDPAFVRAAWAAFYATGQDGYVDRVVALVPLLNFRDQTIEKRTGETAVVSLSAHCREHPRVMLRVKRLAVSHQDEMVRGYLAYIVKSIEAPTAKDHPVASVAPFVTSGK